MLLARHKLVVAEQDFSVYKWRLSSVLGLWQLSSGLSVLHHASGVKRQLAPWTASRITANMQ